MTRPDVENEKKPLALYLHIPFCKKKCAYCDFLSFPAGEAEQTEYCDALCREIRQAGYAYSERFTITTVFIGGGTPSFILPEHIGMLMESVNRAFDIDRDAEISMEMNPGTLEMHGGMSALKVYRDAGINRISIGLQTADDTALKMIGRIHTFSDFMDTYEKVRAAGFINVNIDLMAALPGQSYDTYMKSLETIMSLRPEHLSCYSLILEEGTPLFERRDELDLPDEDTERKMYHDTVTRLSGAGYRHYEISNFARDGYECRHNIAYWQRKDYLGLGLGASSCMNEVRWKNPADMSDYNKMTAETETLKDQDRRDFSYRPYISELQRLTEKDRMEEMFFVGLRMMEGVDTVKFRADFGRTVEDVYGGLTEKLIKQGLLKKNGSMLSLTDYGIDISNYVMAQFLDCV